MTKAQYSLAYSKCTDAELRRFVADRGLNTTQPTRKATIRNLRTADRDATFNFLELSGELRNQIYWYLLTLTKKGGTSHRNFCFPEILRTSHQVHDEAEGILYAAENEITIAYTFRPIFWNAQGKHLNISINHRAVGILTDWTLRDSAAILPSFLLKFTKLRLSIDFVSPIYTNQIHRGLRQLDHTLYALSNHLRGGGKLKQITVDAEVQIPSNTFQQQSLTNPLDHLAGDWDFTVNYLRQHRVRNYARKALPEVADRVHGCHYYEDVLANLLASIAKKIPIDTSSLTQIASVRNRLSAFLDSGTIITEERDSHVAYNLSRARRLVEVYS